MARPAAAKATRELEQRLWDAADAMRGGNQEPSEYKHVVLELVFLKYISDRFEERRRALDASLGDPSSEDFIPNPARRETSLEERDEYTSHNVFWVPEQARWRRTQDWAKQPQIGEVIDSAMALIEKENPSVRGVLPRNYGREGLDNGRIGQLVDPARELVKAVRTSATIDWNLKDSVRAAIRSKVRKLLARYDYPADAEARAVELVLEQAELIAAAEAA